MNMENTESTRMIDRLGTASYVIAGVLFGSYLLYLILDANGMVSGETFVISSINQFTLLFVTSVFASIGLYIDERSNALTS